jgi:hypothetical protein
MQNPKTGVTESRLNRRQLIIKSLKLGSAAYVVPMVLSSATPAMAQVTNPACAGVTCETFDQFPCSTNVDCICVTLSNGAGFCVPGSTSCDIVGPCGPGNTCPEGSVCAVNTCCDTPVCAPIGLGALCATGTPPNFIVANRRRGTFAKR